MTCTRCKKNPAVARNHRQSLWCPLCIEKVFYKEIKKVLKKDKILSQFSVHMVGGAHE